MSTQLVDDPNTTRPVPESLWRDAPEYFSRFIPRIHRDFQVCDDATIQCRIDIVGRGQPFIEAGNLCLRAGNLIALTMPDCIPERLALAAYLIEAGFVYDDGEAANADTQITTDKSLYEIKLRNKQVLSKMAVQVMRFDRQLGENVIRGWTTWKKGEEIILPKTAGKLYQDLDEYLPDRFDDIGWPMVINLLHWGTGVVLDESSATEIAPILKPIHDVVTLTNDYFSWEKEIAEHIELNEANPLINSVAFFMKWDSLSATDAKASVKAKIQQLEEEYSALKTEYIARHGDKTPSSVIRWFSIMEAVVAGNLIWSNFTPRYHVSNIKAHEYEEYYTRRIREGTSFFDSCTESDAFIPPVSQETTSELRWSTRHSRVNCPRPENSDPAVDRSFSQEETPRIVNRPFQYIESLPSKGVRSLVLEALNSWYLVPEQQMKQIDSIVRLLHNASLMIDDIQDQTDLRRGKPATHMIFGIGQTINSAYFQCIEALNRANSNSPSMFEIVMDEFRTGHVGQSLDLYWTFQTVVPSEKEYLQMVDAKTSSLFRLCSRLLRSAATVNRDLQIENLATLFGRYFQVRDDYMNLKSQDYTNQKGFCSDLDEGKYSLPLIHALRESDPELESTLKQRLQPGGLSVNSKQWILDRLMEKGSLQYTERQLELLYAAIEDCLTDLEKKTGSMNWVLRRILYQLQN
ncbi:isoprenoid synthase domain-containing protein [Bisporella sp. PMI_857]|nr:isoprenoid synthase domain-containing protein [Bisporella sp. PMI_857]